MEREKIYNLEKSTVGDKYKRCIIHILDGLDDEIEKYNYIVRSFADLLTVEEDKVLKELAEVYLMTFFTGASGKIWGNDFIYDKQTKAIIDNNGKVVRTLKEQVQRFKREYLTYQDGFNGIVILDGVNKKAVGGIYGYKIDKEDLINKKLSIESNKRNISNIIPDNPFYLSNFFINSNFRGKGIGKLLFIKFLSATSNKDIKKIILRTHVESGFNHILRKYFNSCTTKLYEYGDGRIIYLISLS